MRIRGTESFARKDYAGRRPPHYIYLKYKTFIIFLILFNYYLISIDLIYFISAYQQVKW